MTLYKYLTRDRIDVLETENIRYTQPALLNDPFEMTPTFGELFAAGTFEKMLNFRGKRDIINKVVEALPPNRRFAGKALAWMFFFVRGGQLRANVKTVAEAATVQFRKQFPQQIEKLRHRVGVLSLSERRDNLLMWSHYAGQHSGLVIAVDEKHPVFDQRRSPEDEFHHLRRVVYSKDKPKNRLADMNGVDLLLRKSSDWAYEQEWRIAKPLESASAMAMAPNRNVYLFEFPAAAIEGVILGAHMSEEDRTAITAVLSGENYDHAWLKQAEVKRDKFALDFLKLPKTARSYPPLSTDLHVYGLEKDAGEDVADIIKVAAQNFALQPLNLSRLKHIYICPDVRAMIAEVFQQKEWNGSEEAQVLGVPAGGEVDVLVFLWSGWFKNWATLPQDEKPKLLHKLHREFAHVHNVTMRYRALGEKALTMPKPGTAGYLGPVALNIWNDYIVARLSAGSLPPLEIYDAMRKVLDSSVASHAEVIKELAAYKQHGDLSRLMIPAARSIQTYLCSVATMMGYVDGGHQSHADTAQKTGTVGGSSYEALFADLTAALRRMHRYYPEWQDFNVYDDLMYVVRSLAFMWGIALRDLGERIHVAVP